MTIPKSWLLMGALAIAAYFLLRPSAAQLAERAREAESIADLCHRTGGDCAEFDRDALIARERLRGRF